MGVMLFWHGRQRARDAVRHQASISRYNWIRRPRGTRCNLLPQITGELEFRVDDVSAIIDQIWSHSYPRRLPKYSATSVFHQRDNDDGLQCF